MNNFVPRDVARYEKGSRAIRVNLSRAPRWRTDHAKPQQDVHQLYRIATFSQKPAICSSIKNETRKIIAS